MSDKPADLDESSSEELEEETDNIVHTICRRDSLSGGPCEGDRARVVPLNHAVRYVCENCGGSWVVATGGSFEL